MLDLIIEQDKKNQKIFLDKGKTNVYFFPKYVGDFGLELILEENVELNLYILAIGGINEKNNLNFKINHVGSGSKSFIWSKILSAENSFQKIKIDVDMLGVDSISNNLQKQILLSENARSVCEPIIITKGESIVANHGASSGLNIDTELFFFELRGVDTLRALQLLIEKEIFEVNWPDFVEHEIREKMNRFDYSKILKALT